MRVIVTGGRLFKDDDMMRFAMDRLPSLAGPSESIVIVHGGCKRWDRRHRRWVGADYLAELEAKARGWTVVAYRADWAAYGRSAGPIRNRRMVKGGADFLLKFPGGRGTDDCAQLAARAGIPVFDADALYRAVRGDEGQG